MEITKDKKGLCWIISHKRSGYHEEITFTETELAELFFEIKKILKERYG